MKNKPVAINQGEQIEQKRGRGRPNGAVTTDRPLRLRLTIALAQSLIIGAAPNEPVSLVESKIFNVMLREDGNQYLGSAGSGKCLRRYLDGEVSLPWEGLKAIAKAGRSCGYLNSDVNNSEFFDDLLIPDLFLKVRKGRSKVEDALGTLRKAAQEMTLALRECDGHAVIDETGLVAVLDAFEDAGALSREEAKAWAKFDLEKFVFQLEHLFVSPHPDLRRAPVPLEVAIKNNWYEGGLRHLGPEKNRWQ